MEAVEWIASDRETGVLRLRGDFGRPVRERPAAPVLVLHDESGELTRRPALNDDAPEGDGWRAAYLVAGALLGGAREKWLEWPDGARLALPDVDVSGGDGRTAAPPPQREAEVFDRAVLAERRARRAESAQRAQARTAEAAVAALGALERRVEELTRERDALAATRVPSDDAAVSTVRLVPAVPEPGPADPDLVRELEAARGAAREAEERARRHDQALGEALGALGRVRVQAAELRLRMRTQMASASADAVRLAVLERERHGVRGRLQVLRAELDAMRGRVAREQALSQRLAAELEEQRAATRRVGWERDELGAAMAVERRLRRRSEEALAHERSEAQARGARILELEDALDEERGAVHRAQQELRRRVEDLGKQLRAERTARASAQMRLRVSRSSESAARAEAAARAATEARLRGDLERALAAATATGAPSPSATAPRSSPAPGDESAGSARRSAELETELAETRAALKAAREQLGRETPAAAADQAAMGVRKTGADAPGSTGPARSALSPALTAQLRERIAALQAAAAGADADAGAAVPPRDDIAARLDAAAASLRAAQGSEAPLTTAANPSTSTPTVMPAPARTPPPGRATSLALTVRPVADVMIAAGTVSDAAAPVGVRRLGRLRAALVGLAVADPFAAARLLASLLPAQGAFLREDIDYDLTIRELGTFAVTVTAGRTSVRLLARPRPRREAQMHLTAHALTLAELLAGRPRRVGRVLAPVRLRGARRGLEVLAALAEARASLAEVARAGADLDPSLLVRALPYLIDPADTHGHRFTVAHELVDGSARTSYLTVHGRRGLKVSASAPEQGADARVTMSRETFDRLLRMEPPDRADKPWIRGDFTAVETLRRWIDAARG